MPPLSAIRVPALRELAEQLRFAPRDALLRDVERAEALAGEVAIDGKYPPEWIVFRVTGYRPTNTIGDEASVAGDVLLADLSAFVERLCDAMKLARTEVPLAIDSDALAAKWNVSRKTLDRYRRRGLVARRVVAADRQAALVFVPSIVEGFAARHAKEIARAAGFSRIPAPMAAAIVRRATRYHARLGWSLNQSAQRLAERFDRSHEAVRQVIKRAEATAAARGSAPVFDERGPISPRDRQVLWRCWLRGLEPGQVAVRLKCSRASALRAINLERAARLSGLLGGSLPQGPAKLVKVNLSHSACSTGLGQPGATSVPEFFAEADAQRPVSAVDEGARIAGLRHLRARAANAIHQLARLYPSAESLDAIETDLRWSSRIKAELVRAQLGLVVATLRERLGEMFARLEPAQQRSAIEAAMRGLLEAVDAHDPTSAPGRGGRLAGAASLAIDRAIVRWMKDITALQASGKDRSRAAARLGSVELADWTRTVDPWQAWLEPPARVRKVVGRVSDVSRRCLEARYGWSGGPPGRIEQLCTLLALTRMRAVQVERRAFREALQVARGGGSESTQTSKDR